MIWSLVRRVAAPLFLGGLSFALLSHANGGSLFSGSVLSTHCPLFTTHSRVQQRTAGAKAGEEFVGGGYVFRDLGAEFFGAAEFFFFAEALPEMDFDAARGDFRNGLEDMRFDAEGRTVEGGAHADICDRTASARFALEKRARDVDAASGQEFLLGSEIQRGKGEAAASAGARDDFTGEDEGTAEKAGGMRNVTCGDLAADDGAGDDFVFADDGRENDDVETAVGAEQEKHPRVAGLFVAEAEIFADINGANAQIADEDLVHEFFGSESCEVVSEGEDEGGFDAEFGEAAQALLGGGDAQGSGFRAKNFLR